MIALAQLTVYPRAVICNAPSFPLCNEIGLWRKALEQATDRLRVNGLRAIPQARALPRLPRRVAVITSPDGAALRDVVSVDASSLPNCQDVLVPAKAGEGAPDLAHAINRVSRWGDVDTD